MKGYWVRSAIWTGLLPICAPALQLFSNGPVSPFANVPHRTVTGTVVNAITGEPIRRALVQVNGSASGTAFTGPDGRFKFDDIPEGPVNLIPQKPGYFDLQTSNGGQWNQESTMFTVGAEKNDFRIKLYPFARINGTITDQEGEEVAGATVDLMSEQIIEGRKQWTNRGTYSTDDDGSFRLDDLAPGRYVVFFGGRATPPQQANAPWEVFVPVYYQDAADLASAQMIELQPGEHFRADFHVKSERGFSIRGRIASSAASAGLSLTAEDGQNIHFGQMELDQGKGEFSISGVPPGRWTFSYFGNDGQGHTLAAKQEVAVSHADISNLQLVPSALSRIPVVVNHAAKADQAPTGQQPSAPNFYATLIAQDSFKPMQYGPSMLGDPPLPGFSDVQPGKYRLRVPITGNECVESAWYGNVDLLSDSFVISEGSGTTQPIIVNMQAGCATLRVNLKSKDQRTAGVVLLVPSKGVYGSILLPLQSRNRMPLSTVLPLLSPGSYEVYAFSNIAGLEYANPEVLRSYVGRSVDLVAGQNSEVTVEFSERKGN